MSNSTTLKLLKSKTNTCDTDIGQRFVQIISSLSLSRLTSVKSSSQQVLCLQAYTVWCTEQPQAVRGALPRRSFLLLHLPQDVQRIWTARNSPRWAPSMVRLFPSLIMWHWAPKASSGSRNRSSRPRESIWGSKTATYFQKIDSSSPSSCQRTISFLHARKLSTKVKPNISSWMHVCQTISVSWFLTTVEYYCLSPHPVTLAKLWWHLSFLPFVVLECV
jgi:hypothetical protein